MIQLSHGSIFDKKCDLLIVPCNSAGGVTPWVYSSLKENGLPAPETYIPFGKVQFVETRLSLENAEVVGFAASVDANTNWSSKEAISSIGEEIFGYCDQHSLRQVNLPLLGTGAGKLSVLNSFEALIKSFHFEENIETCFEFFTPELDIYKEIYNKAKERGSELVGQSKQEKLKNPRVFVSYAKDDNNNADWVKKLVTELRENGVDARLDRFHLKPGTDLPQWMTNELIMADKVLLICDSNYVKKADIRKGGAGWETMIIQGDMLTQGESKTKYIAIVRETEIDKGLPIYMKSKLAMHWKSDDEILDGDFKELLYAIFDCDITPELGDIPGYISEKLQKLQ